MKTRRYFDENLLHCKVMRAVCGQQWSIFVVGRTQKPHNMFFERQDGVSVVSCCGFPNYLIEMPRFCSRAERTEELSRTAFSKFNNTSFPCMSMLIIKMAPKRCIKICTQIDCVQKSSKLCAEICTQFILAKGNGIAWKDKMICQGK